MTKYLFSNSTGFNDKRKKGCAFFPPIKTRNYIFRLHFFYILTQNHATTSLASLTFTEAIHNKNIYLTLIDDHYAFIHQSSVSLCVMKDVTFFIQHTFYVMFKMYVHCKYNFSWKLYTRQHTKTSKLDRIYYYTGIFFRTLGKIYLF